MPTVPTASTAANSRMPATPLQISRSSETATLSSFCFCTSGGSRRMRDGRTATGGWRRIFDVLITRKRLRELGYRPVSGSCALAGLGEQVGLVLAPHPRCHFCRVISALGVTADVGQAEFARRDGLDFRPEVVAGGEVEAHRAAAAAAIFPVALPQLGDPLQLLLLALELPRIDVAGDDRLAHALSICTAGLPHG